MKQKGLLMHTPGCNCDSLTVRTTRCFLAHSVNLGKNTSADIILCYINKILIDPGSGWLEIKVDFASFELLEFKALPLSVLRFARLSSKCPFSVNLRLWENKLVASLSQLCPRTGLQRPSLWPPMEMGWKPRGGAGKTAPKRLLNVSVKGW